MPKRKRAPDLQLPVNVKKIAAATALLESAGYTVTPPAAPVGRPRVAAGPIIDAIASKNDGTRSLTSIYREVAKELGIGYGTVFRAAKANSDFSLG